MSNKQTLTWIISLIIVFIIGIYIGKSLVTPPDVVKQNTLKEIDQKFMEKVKNGLLPIFVTEENASREVTSFEGEIIEISPQIKTLKLKVPNIYRGGSITKFLYEPDYFIKQVVVGRDTRIVMVEIEINEESFEPQFKEIPVPFSNLSVGQYISVETKTPVVLEEDIPVIAKVIRVE